MHGCTPWRSANSSAKSSFDIPACRVLSTVVICSSVRSCAACLEQDQRRSVSARNGTVIVCATPSAAATLSVISELAYGPARPRRRSFSSQWTAVLPGVYKCSCHTKTLCARRNATTLLESVTIFVSRVAVSVYVAFASSAPGVSFSTSSTVFVKHVMPFIRSFRSFTAEMLCHTRSSSGTIQSVTRNCPSTEEPSKTPLIRSAFGVLLAHLYAVVVR